MAEENKVPKQPTAVAPQKQPPAQPPFKITTTHSRSRYLNMLLYGDYGAGKTYLAGTSVYVPTMQNVLMLSVEAGELSVETFPDLDIAPITDYKQFARAYEYLRAHCAMRDAGKYEEMIKQEIWFKGLNLPYEDPYEEEERLAAIETIKQTPRTYRTVIVDSLTEVQKYCMYQLLGIKVGAQALDLEPDNPQYAEWGKSAEMIRLLVRTFRDLPMHVVFVCSKQEKEDDRKRMLARPALPGKLASEVQGFFDVVGYLVAVPAEGGVVQRRLYLTPGVTYQAKHRFNAFKGTYLPDPHMEDLIALSRQN